MNLNIQRCWTEQLNIHVAVQLLGCGWKPRNCRGPAARAVQRAVRRSYSRWCQTIQPYILLSLQYKLHMPVGRLNVLPNTLRWPLPCVMAGGLPFLIQTKTFFFVNCDLAKPCLKIWTSPPPKKNHKGPPLWWQLRKIVGKWILIAHKNGPGSLNATQKTWALCKAEMLPAPKFWEISKILEFS